MFDFRRKKRKQFRETEKVFGNPLMGYAPNAWESEVSEDVFLLYMDITWAELEPEEGVFAWEMIERENQIIRWKSEGKHLILRFVCDMPGEKKYMDIPEWLYEKSGKAGKWYDCSYGKGFAPDYRNPVLISCHERAVQALGRHFGKDGLVSYIELGSLGHWGEWHVNYSIGISRLPETAVREKYVLPWIKAFPDAMILMRRPFSSAEKYGLGLYNDMIGQTEETEIWLHWIREGGRYEQTGEEKAIVPMKDFWKTAPSGGELTSSLSMEKILERDLPRTTDMIRAAHTTFLGPKIPEAKYADGYKEILKNMGYRLWISKAEIKQSGEECRLKLVWKNSGMAPLYKDWPVYIYVENDAGKLIEKQQMELKISSILPEEETVTEVRLSAVGLYHGLENGWKLAIGIEDFMTGIPCVRLAMDVLYKDGKNYLW